MAATPPQFAALTELFSQRVLKSPYVFECRIQVESPCSPRREAWFAAHKEAIINATDHAYKNHTEKLPSIAAFSQELKEHLFEKVRAVYVEAAASKSCRMKISQGCCNNFKQCSLVWYQRFLLQAMRKEPR